MDKCKFSNVRTYPAKLDGRQYELGVYDGDTISMIIDPGFDLSIAKRIRLLGVNTPEIRGETRGMGLHFKELTKQWFYSNIQPRAEWPLIIHTEKDDSFGRYLAHVYAVGNNESLNQYLINNGSPIYEG